MNQLTLDQLAEQSPVATQELIRLRAELERLRAFKAEAEKQEPEPYDAGFLNDFGGGNVSWWHDYIRAELDRAHDHYAQQFITPADKPAVTVPDGWRIIEKKTCYALLRGNDVIATLAGPDAEENAAIISSMLTKDPSHSQQSAHDSEQGGES